jgi:hypothetical protein
MDKKDVKNRKNIIIHRVQLTGCSKISFNFYLLPDNCPLHPVNGHIISLFDKFNGISTAFFGCTSDNRFILFRDLVHFHD